MCMCVCVCVCVCVCMLKNIIYRRCANNVALVEAAGVSCGSCSTLIVSCGSCSALICACPCCPT